MVRKDGAWVRAQRIQAIHNLIKGKGNVSLSRLLALCSYKFGLTHATAMNYLRTLEDGGFIEIDEELELVWEIEKE